MHGDMAYAITRLLGGPRVAGLGRILFGAFCALAERSEQLRAFAASLRPTSVSGPGKSVLLLQRSTARSTLESPPERVSFIFFHLLSSAEARRKLQRPMLEKLGRLSDLERERKTSLRRV